MKSIKKIGKTVATSALLLGATVVGGAAMASAQDGSSGTLGDYPAPFVDEDGAVNTNIVVGESAATVDVVGAVDIAGALSQHAYETSTETVSTSGVGGSWSAANGVTLDTRNDDLFFGDQINNVRDTLTQSDLNVLSEHTFTDDGGTDYDITQYVNVGSQSVTFGNSADGLDDEDPVVHVPVPAESEVDDSTYLMSVQANMETINMTDSDVQGETIEMFGNDYTVSQSDNSEGDDQLVLYGSSQTETLSTGEETTVTIDGDEHTIAVESVNDATTAAITVNGDISSENVGDSINLDTGDEIRVDEIINTGASDDGQGQVKFELGSEKLKFEAGEPIQDKDDDDIEGTYVSINGHTSSGPGSSAYQVGAGVSSIEVYLGSSDDDEDYLEAGDSWSHERFSDFQVHVGGLNPDAMEEGDDVEAFNVEGGDEDVSISFTSDSGDSANVNFVHRNGSTDSDGLKETNDELGDQDDAEDYIVQEGALVTESDYVAADAGDFAHLYEVTSIDTDNTAGNIESGDEAEISLQDTVTGNSVTVDLDAQSSGGSFNNNGYYAGSEIIDGQTYHFTLEGSSDGTNSEAFNSNNALEFRMTWGTGADHSGNGADEVISGNWATGSTVTDGSEGLYAPLDTASGSAVAFTDNVTLATGAASGTETFELPSTQSTDAATVGIEYDTANSDNVNVTSTSNVNTIADPDDTDFVTVATNGGQQYNFTTRHNDLEVAPYDSSDGSLVTSPAAVVMQPEDDGDNEEAWTVTPTGYDSSDSYDVSSSSAVTYTQGVSTTQLDSDSDVEQDFTGYGSFVEQDTGDQGEVTFHVPYGQSTAGVAVTEDGGSISSEGGGSGSVETQMPAGWPESGMLDSDVGTSERNENMVLVGGPAVNTLVQELAGEDKTWSGDDYSEGTAVIDLVNDAFNEGSDALVVAGYSGQDTRDAASALANMNTEDDTLLGEDVSDATTVQIDTGQDSVISTGDGTGDTSEEDSSEEDTSDEDSSGDDTEDSEQ